MNEFHFSKQENISYPKPPFHPLRDYIEFNSSFNKYDETNYIYGMVRDIFINALLDKANINTQRWNPFRGLVFNNQEVVIKPNLVMEEKGRLIGHNCVMTHASILRPILDYMFLLQKMDNILFKVVIADVPLQSAQFDLIIEQTGLKCLIEFYKSQFSFDIEILDLRQEIAIIDSNGFIEKIIKKQGDPKGYTNVHLNESFLDGIISYSSKFSVGDYNDEETKKKHSKIGSHYYNIPNTIIQSDVFINIPKIKVHQKSGISAALKNLIGINGDKSWIPHYRKGSPKFGGDEFDDKLYILKYLNRFIRRSLQGKSQFAWSISKSINRKIIKRLFYPKNEIEIKNRDSELDPSYSYKFIMSGAWYGNDTLWRPILDLNRLLFTIDKSGKITNSIQRKYLCLGDGIVSAEGNGPLKPTPNSTGLITYSLNPVIHDICCARMMGFDWKRIPQLTNSVYLRDLFLFDDDVHNITIKGAVNNSKFNNIDYDKLPNFKFLPPPGWIGNIERIE